MKSSAAERHKRRERKAARRGKRVAKRDPGRATRRRQRQVDDGAVRFWEVLMAPIVEQSKRRQKALDKEARAKAKARRAWLPEGG